MHVLFCADPLDARRPDALYADEADAAQSVGFARSLIDYEALVGGDAARAVARVTPDAGLSLYRGWMLRPAQYAALYDALAARGIYLINDPDDYRHAHSLFEVFPSIAARTMRTVWTNRADLSPDKLRQMLLSFGDTPIIVKDWVKSRKHEWDDACFIRSAADTPEAIRVVGNFVRGQGDDLAEGLVFREFIPLAGECRIFYLDGKAVFWTAYAGGTQSASAPEPWKGIARGIPSRFWTLDVAERRDGGWLIVEVGDGQVSGLPDGADPITFYSALRDAWPDENEGNKAGETE